MISRLSGKDDSERTNAEAQSDENVLKRASAIDNDPDNSYYKLFYKKQLVVTSQPKNYNSELEDKDWNDTNEFLSTAPFEKSKLIDVNYIFFDILDISRISIEDNTWSCDLHMDLITEHDQGIDIIQFHNLSHRYGKLKSELVSFSTNPDNPNEKSFRYLISATFEFRSIPDNYPFDQQLIHISYSTTDTDQFGIIQPVPLRKIDNTFTIDGWDVTNSISGLERIKETKNTGFDLSQEVNIKEFTKVGWEVSRKSSMTMIKILLPLAFLFSLNYYSLFVPIDELGDAISILTTVFLASIALYFSTERPQPLSMTIIDIIFASFYSITGVTIIFVVLAKMNNDIALYLLNPLILLIPLSFMFLGGYISKRIHSKLYKPRLAGVSTRDDVHFMYNNVFNIYTKNIVKLIAAFKEKIK
jgi:hypothetical protein